MINDTLYKRRYIIAAIMTVVVVVYIIRLFSLQILNDKYAERADSNALLRKTQYPPRGLIYDRNGTATANCSYSTSRHTTLRSFCVKCPINSIPSAFVML